MGPGSPAGTLNSNLNLSVILRPVSLPETVATPPWTGTQAVQTRDGRHALSAHAPSAPTLLLTNELREWHGRTLDRLGCAQCAVEHRQHAGESGEQL